MGKNKQRNVSFSQLMNSVDDSVKSKDEQIIPEKKEQPKVEEPVVEKAPVEVPENSTVMTDKDGQQVAKPTVDTTSEVITPAVKYAESSHTPINDTPTGATTPEAQRVSQFIKEYLDYNNGNIMKSEKDKLVAGRKFRDILFYGLDHPTPDVLDQLYKFFLKNKDRVLAPEIALPNTLSFDKVTCERINCLYTLFRGLTEEQPFRINVANTRLLLKSVDSTKVDALLMYFENKQKR